MLAAALEEIPDEIFELSQLETLAFVNSKIRVVPERIRELQHLKRLDLRGSPIESVPDIHGLALDWEHIFAAVRPFPRKTFQACA